MTTVPPVHPQIAAPERETSIPIETGEGAPMSVRGRGNRLTVEIPPDARLHEPLHVDGHVRVGDGAVLARGVKATRDVHVEAHVRFGSKLTVGGDLHWKQATCIDRVTVEGALRGPDGRVRVRGLVARRGVRPSREA